MSILNRDKPLFKGGFRQSAHVQHYGLLNQGATCYLNSVLQVLFMTKDFREAVERYALENPHTEHIDRQLKALFDDLKKGTAKISKIKHKLGIDKVHEQGDAAEYFEKILSLTSPEASQIFHGELTHETKCSECLKKTNANGHFWHLLLKLGDSDRKNVVNGIEEYFQTSHFNGENQIYCEQCDSKSDATIKCQLKCHPEVLTLLLKSFDFDYHHMSYVKNDCAVNVPLTLQIPENQMYELYAVVEHFGDRRSGHYTATVKSQDYERWYKFNDANVTLLDYQPFQIHDTEKYHNAYLLFYRKKTTDIQGTRNILTNKGLPSATGGNANIKPKYDEKGREEKIEWFPEGTGIDAQNYNFGQLKVDKERYASIDKKRKTEGDKESGRKRKYSNRDAKHQNNQGLDSVRYIDNDQAGECKTRKGYDFDEDKNRGGVKDGKQKHSTRYDNYHESRGEEKSGHRQQNLSTNNSWGKQGESKRLNKREREREERREFKGEKEQKQGDDETAQSRRNSDRHRHIGLDEEDWTTGRSAEERQSRPEHRISVSMRRDLSHGQAGNAGMEKMRVNKGVQRVQMSSERKVTAEKPVESRVVFKRKSDPQANENNSLTKRFCEMNLNETPVPKPQRNSHVIDEAKIVHYSRGAYAMRKKGAHKMKRERLWKSWISCFSVLQRKRKNTDRVHSQTKMKSSLHPM